MNYWKSFITVVEVGDKSLQRCGPTELWRFLLQIWLLVGQAAPLGKKKIWQSFQESWSISIWFRGHNWHFLLRMGWNRALSMRVLTLLFWNNCNSFGKIECFPCFFKFPLNYLFVVSFLKDCLTLSGWANWLALVVLALVYEMSWYHKVLKPKKTVK